jgi:hypothetical protein
MARSFYHLSILVLVSILLRPSPLPSKLFCLLELTQPAEFGGEVMCTAVLWPYVCQRMSDFFLEQLRLENLVACKWKMLFVSFDLGGHGNDIKKINCTLMKCHTSDNSTSSTQLPHKFSYIVAILGHNHFESPNIWKE